MRIHCMNYFSMRKKIVHDCLAWGGLQLAGEDAQGFSLGCFNSEGVYRICGHRGETVQFVFALYPTSTGNLHQKKVVDHGSVGAVELSSTAN